ncbi:two-component system sensor histidine kinase RppB [Chroococcus sp. FPU101]|uniref:two-component system sensor histidine kinase RppB n=1 Tax=Chroococcus sp. FPU101 TaxID=1974212 RepID=UPI001A9099CB|nr:two-component system sensor histidine kinase RppB [Chroococcus sp. FPU101]GFE68985.1 two-component sensor histidine kinase [Chroococcus sp. FPU101]
MQQNSLFNKTRLRLAFWYASVMGLILSLSGFGVYRAIAHAHMVALDREIASVAGTIHDSLELKLQNVGQIEPIVYQLLPDLCTRGNPCFAKSTSDQNSNNNCRVAIYTSASSARHILSVVGQGNYYLRLLDLKGCLIGFIGMPPQVSSFPVANQWQILKDEQGNRYHQISFLLHTNRQENWGYIELGRSFKEFDDYLSIVRIILFLGLPIILLLIGGSSWWLAGLAMKPIYQSYQQIQQFTADAAHELRTPLAATLATVESARKEQLEPLEMQNILTTIERQNRRLATLVNDLLLLSRLDRQSMTQRFESCCLNDIVSDLIEELSALAIASNLTLTEHILVAQPLYVKGNLEQLYRLVSNLIVNAIQYTPAKGQVKVTLNRVDNYGLIEIHDTGIGIPPSEQKRIFDRFYRVDSARSRQTGGSGLGLAIANAIVQAHQGSIQVHSELGKGSTFTIRLPIERSIQAHIRSNP